MRILLSTFLGGDGMNHVRSERSVRGGCILDIHIYLDILDILLKSTKSVDELDTTGLGDRKIQDSRFWSEQQHYLHEENSVAQAGLGR